MEPLWDRFSSPASLAMMPWLASFFPSPSRIHKYLAVILFWSLFHDDGQFCDGVYFGSVLLCMSVHEGIPGSLCSGSCSKPSMIVSSDLVAGAVSKLGNLSSNLLRSCVFQSCCLLKAVDVASTHPWVTTRLCHNVEHNLRVLTGQRNKLVTKKLSLRAEEEERVVLVGER